MDVASPRTHKPKIVNESMMMTVHCRPKMRALVKSDKEQFNFLISQPKHMLVVLKKPVSMSTQNMLKLMGKNIFTRSRDNALLMNSDRSS